MSSAELLDKLKEAERRERIVVAMAQGLLANSAINVNQLDLMEVAVKWADKLIATLDE